MSRNFIRFQDVSFGYSGAEEPLFSHLIMHAAQGWSGVIGANGAGKSTLLKLASGLMEPDTGIIEAPQRAVYCAQRTDEPPERFEEFLSDFAKPANVLRDRLGVEFDWLYRWPTLSHGERKRAQVAVALWQEPELLAIDEPFNHLDRDARDMIAQSLKTFRGVGLLVSHDRDILDTLCYQCIFLDPPLAVVRPGGYSKAVAAVEAERSAIENKREQEKREYKRIKKEATRRKDVESRSNGLKSKRGIAKKDHDAKSKRDLARLTGKDATAGKLKQHMENRLNKVKQRLEGLNVKKEYDLGIWFPEAVSHRNELFHLPAGSLELGEGRRLEFPQLVMKPTDRVALTGGNGSGKSTLIVKILDSLTLPTEHVTYVPQEISKKEAERIMEDVKQLPNEPLGFLMTVVRRLGSNPRQLLRSSTPSPGEMRKLLLALGLTRKPHLIVMDEPTNHMDLPSIRCLEQALAGCPCGLMLVSHDRRFLGALTSTAWHIPRGGLLSVHP